MSSEEVHGHNGALPTAGEVPELDVAKLHALPSEQQGLFLLTFAAEFRRSVERLTAESLPSKQQLIKKEVVKVVGLATPTPSRPVRLCLAKALADSFERGSRSLLYETINELISFLSTGKNDKDIGTKHVAVVCLGEVFHAAGDSAVSLSGLVVQTLTKVLRASHTGFRGSTLRSLSLLVAGLGVSLDEHVARDVWKAARNSALSDKSALVQIYAFDCIRSLCDATTYFNNSSDFETLQSTAWRILDSPVAGVRHSVAKALASAMTAAYSETSATDVPVIRKPKKSSKKLGEDEDDTERMGSPAPSAKPSIQLALNLADILKLICRHFIKSTTTNRGRVGLAMCLKYTLRQLPSKIVNHDCGRIAEYLFTDLLDHPSMDFNRYRYLMARNLVSRILRSMISLPSLSENAQINATRYIINEVVKNYPKVVRERREPSKRVLTGALDFLNQLLIRLGSAASVLQDSCREALCQVIQHPSYTVQSYAAQCFRSFVLSCPNQLVRTIDELLSRLRTSLDTAADPRPNLRVSSGLALGLAAMLHSANAKPLFGSVHTYSQVLAFATDLLKASATSELRHSAAQVQVAWTLLGGLMNLGPSFVKVHLNQLLLLWRNALPPPMTPDNAAQRSQLELSFLCHVRECALSGLLAFLDGCSTLVTTDGSRRISNMLQNTLEFLDNLPNVRNTEHLGHRLVPALQLQDMVYLLRRRVLQCFCSLFRQKHVDLSEALSRSDLVGISMRVFTMPDRPAQKSVEASLANSASNFEGVWEAGDNWGYGVSSLVRGQTLYYPDLAGFRQSQTPQLSSESRDSSFDDFASLPTLPALENDPALLYRPGSSMQEVELGSASTACIDYSIKLFSIVFALQSARVQEISLEQMATILSQPLQREPGRKAAVQTNAAVALLYALSVANNETGFSPGKVHIPAIGKLLSDLLRASLSEQDVALRETSARALGLTCNLGGTQFTNTEVKALIDLIVANRDPHTRAGCAAALGYIHAEVGAMASSLHIKSIVGVLLSLCNDTHPVVHFWALRGLNQVADSAGLNFSAYATSTLGLLAQLYSSDSHNAESSSLITSNSELEYSTTLCIAQSVDCIINVIGPDLQDLSKPRNLILTLIGYLKIEESAAIKYHSFVCLGHLSMYAPAHLQFASHVLDLQQSLVSTDELLSNVAVTGLSDFMKRNASEVSRVATWKLSDDIWMTLDERPNDVLLQNMLRNWMQQSMLASPGEWVDRCQTILSRTRMKEPLKRAATIPAKTAISDLADEEVAGFAAAAAAAQGDNAELASEGQDFLRWQTRDFAMRLLSDGLQMVQDATLSDQVMPAEEELHGKVADIIRVAFSASTAGVVELRIWGLRIIDQILRMFGKTPDPDFLEASLLEQYQAQISSALTPAFAADSSPELASEAIAVCATFVATGIVTTADRMGRIFKVMAAGIENLAQPQPEAAIGDLKNLSPNAQSMLKMALLSGWAQLQLASLDQNYLEDIVQPYIAKLAPLWLNALQEFARLRFEPEISDTLGGDTLTSNLDERYASFNRVIRLRFYQKNWLNIVNAISALVDRDSDAVFDALDKKEALTSSAKINGIAPQDKSLSFREEPVAFFFILFGLAFEALVTRAREDSSQAFSILKALKKILTPAVSGNAVYEESVFNETTDTLDRLAMTGTSQTQSVLIDIARNLSMHHPSAKSIQDRDEKLSDDIEQLFELTRIITLVMTGLIPTLEDPPGAAVRRLGAESVALVQLSFQALADVAETFPSIIRTDLHACVLHCYSSILATGVCQEEVLPSLLPMFRAFLASVSKSTSETTSQLVRGSLHQMLVILSIAQRRENEFAITCAKNSLLSITVLLTSGASVVAPNDDLIRRSLAEILDCLQDVGLAKVAANCIRTLLITTPKTPCDDAVGRLLWPKIIHFICDPDSEDPENVGSFLVQALVGSVATLRQERRQSAIAILIPVLLLRAGQKVPNGSQESLSKESASRLLELAAASQQAFRATVGLLDDDRRGELETLLRTVGVGRRQETDEEDMTDSRPTIELRMDF